MAKRQTYILKNINSKLEKENAIVAKADDGKACVIMYSDVIIYTDVIIYSDIIIYTDEYNKKSTNSLMRTTLKNCKKIPRTNTKNLSPRPYNIATLSSIRNKRSTSHRRNPNPPT